MRIEYRVADRIWNPDDRPDLTDQLLSHLDYHGDCCPGEPLLVILSGTGHPSHIKINGWPYAYLGTDQDGNAVYYQSY